jgi:hypothetical protein
VQLSGLAATHRTGPDFLNVLRVLDVPQTVAMVAEKTRIELEQEEDADWEYSKAVAKNLGWADQIRIGQSPR